MRDYAYVSIGNKKLWIPSKSRKIRFDNRRLSEILAADMKEETKKNYKMGNVNADPSIWELL